MMAIYVSFATFMPSGLDCQVVSQCFGPAGDGAQANAVCIVARRRKDLNIFLSCPGQGRSQSEPTRNHHLI